MSTMLPWVATVSSFGVILCVIALFVFMVVFILRLNYVAEMLPGLNSSSVHHVNMTNEVKVQGINNPFYVEMNKKIGSSLLDGSNLELSLLQDCRVDLIWGADIGQLYHAMQSSWDMLKCQLTEGKFLAADSLHVENFSDEFLSCNKEIHIQCPSCVDADKLGHQPRQRYPLLLVLSVLNKEQIVNDDIEENNAVALFTVIHLKDAICQLESQILYQYLKTSNGSICELQPLFVNTTLRDEDSLGSSTHENNRADRENAQCRPTTLGINSLLDRTNDKPDKTEETKQNSLDCDNQNSFFQDSCSECIVCQNSSVAIVLLPCRHTCICSTCFHQLDRCPMCRGSILSYFHIGYKETAGEDISCSESEESPSPSSESTWSRINRALNERLGFSQH